MKVELSGIVIQFPEMENPVLKVADETIENGARLLIRGPSGSGKTSLLHVIAGLLDPAKGRVNLDTRDLVAMKEGQRCRLRRESLGFVFQRLNILGHLTALENVLLGSPGNVLKRDKAMLALEEVGMSSLAGKLACHLSLGEQQRVAVARVIVRSPSLILADEPTSSLDAANAEIVMDALFRSAGENGSLVVATHDDRVASHFSNIWTLAGGVIQ
jgi:ABC-type lipoprotein export system ATPase subunit